MLKKHALFSVYDKRGIVGLAQTLLSFDIELLATSGTGKTLAQAGLPFKEVSELTDFPEMMDGRVKTLHPKIHGGILARRDQPSHQKALASHQIPPIDFLIVNFYPFAETLAKGASTQECIEQIDIGAPAMVRAAAKNHEFVTIIVDSADYRKLEDEIKAQAGTTRLAFRKKCAHKAFATTSFYDAQIATWMQRVNASDDKEEEELGTPFVLVGTLKQRLRYGENPHQRARLFALSDNQSGIVHGTVHGTVHGNVHGIVQAQQIQGKPLSYNNFVDADSAWSLVQAFSTPSAAIIKHANPCGVAIGSDIVKAYEVALNADKTSAFGGIVAVNRPISEKLAQKMTKLFTECVIAPSLEKGAVEVFSKKKNLRLLIAKPDLTKSDKVQMISGGFLVQESDHGVIDKNAIKNIGGREATEQEAQDMLFAWKVCKYVKSNAIILAKDGASCGIGAGQMNRLDSARLALSKKPQATKDVVAASDGFFPFVDGVKLLAEAGVKAIIQPGGSIRDQEVQAYAHENNLVMWLTGMRHFRH